MAGSPVNLMFPFKGIDQGASYADIPEGMTPDALNVRPYDSIERRLRGGSRAGISKYFPATVSGSNPVQAINSFVEAFDPTNIVIDQIIDENADGYTDTFTGLGSDTPIQTHNAEWTNHEGGSYFDATANTSNGMTVFATHGATAAGTAGGDRAGIAYSVQTLGSAYIVEMAVQYGSAPGTAGLVWRLSANPTTRDFYVLRMDNATTIRLISYTAGAATTQATYTVSSMAASTEHRIKVQINGNVVKSYLNDALIGTHTMTLHASNSRVGLIAERSTTIPANLVIRWFRLATGILPASLRSTKIVAVAGGTIRLGPPSTGLVTPTGGASAVSATGPIGVQPAFQQVFFCDGLKANYKVYKTSTNAVTGWAASVTDGTLPEGSVNTTLGCRMIALYRGRIVLSGLQEDPQNWFMSRVDDPYDWDYSPAVTTPVQAVAGNNSSSAGLVGDIITSLMPFQDDLLFMGGDHTLWVMRGDPAAGGAIDNISRQIGVVGPDAWTWDTSSNLYFVGQNGLYRMSANESSPTHLSRGRLDKMFAELDYGATSVKLMYDREWQGVHIFICPTNQPVTAGDHWFWDERTNSFWRDQYPPAVGPTCIHLFDADAVDDRAVLLGGYDSYIRKFDISAAGDDGTAINSHVQIPLNQKGGHAVGVRLDDMFVTLAEDSDPVLLQVYAGDTAESAAGSTTVRFARTLVAGRNPFVRQRVRQNSLIVKLSNATLDKRWALESAAGFLKPDGRMRGGTT